MQWPQKITFAEMRDSGVRGPLSGLILDPTPPGIRLVVPRAVPIYATGDYFAAIVVSHF